ncbi:MAG: hypothetical protein P4N24_16130, partial [Acidobacteriota bacterium]|nr:hypothetical protein [Acidobacteriota bacterium]
MRMSFRLILLLVVGVTCLSLIFAVFQVKAEKRGLQKELENRASMVGENLEGKVEPLLNRRSHKHLQEVVTQFGNREHLKGVAIFNKSGDCLATSPGLDGDLRGVLPQVIQVISSKITYASFTTLSGKLTHVLILPLHDESEALGALVVFHDAGFIKAQTSRLWWETFLSVLAQAVFIALVTVLIIRWSIVGPIARTTKWIRDIRAGKRAERCGLDEKDVFSPLTQEVTHLAKSLEVARAAAEEEARLRESGESHWTPERLRLHVRSKLGDRPFFVVSNREPYTHTYRGKNVEVTVPASGLVTA